MLLLLLLQLSTRVTTTRCRRRHRWSRHPARPRLLRRALFPTTRVQPVSGAEDLRAGLVAVVVLPCARLHEALHRLFPRDGGIGGERERGVPTRRRVL